MSRKLSLHLSFAVSHHRGRRGVSQEKGQGIKTAVGNWLNASSSVKQNWSSQRIKQGQKAWVSTTRTLQRREISWILFQYRHYFPCIQKRQNSYILAKQQEAAPIFCYILFVKAEGSSGIILQRKIEDQGGKGIFLGAGKGMAARTECKNKQFQRATSELSDS